MQCATGRIARSIKRSLYCASISARDHFIFVNRSVQIRRARRISGYKPIVNRQRHGRIGNSHEDRILAEGRELGKALNPGRVGDIDRTVQRCTGSIVPEGYRYVSPTPAAGTFIILRGNHE